SGQDGNESVQSSLSSASDCNATQDAVQSGEFAGSALANPVDECWPVDARLEPFHPDRDRRAAMKSNIDGKQARVDGSRDEGRLGSRTRKPAPKPSKQRSRRKTSKKLYSRPSYLPARIIEPLKKLGDGMAGRRDRALLLVLVDSELTPLELVSLSRGQIRVHFARQKDMSVKAFGTGCLPRTSNEPGRKFTIGHEAVGALRDYV